MKKRFFLIGDSSLNQYLYQNGESFYFDESIKDKKKSNSVLSVFFIACRKIDSSQKLLKQVLNDIRGYDLPKKVVFLSSSIVNIEHTGSFKKSVLEYYDHKKRSEQLVLRYIDDSLVLRVGKMINPYSKDLFFRFSKFLNSNETQFSVQHNFKQCIFDVNFLNQFLHSSELESLNGTYQLNLGTVTQTASLLSHLIEKRGLADIKKVENPSEVIDLQESIKEITFSTEPFQSADESFEKYFN